MPLTDLQVVALESGVATGPNGLLSAEEAEYYLDLHHPLFEPETPTQKAERLRIVAALVCDAAVARLQTQDDRVKPLTERARYLRTLAGPGYAGQIQAAQTAAETGAASLSPSSPIQPGDYATRSFVRGEVSEHDTAAHSHDDIRETVSTLQAGETADLLNYVTRAAYADGQRVEREAREAADTGEATARETADTRIAGDLQQHIDSQHNRDDDARRTASAAQQAAAAAERQAEAARSAAGDASGDVATLSATIGALRADSADANRKADANTRGLAAQGDRLTAAEANIVTADGKADAAGRAAAAATRAAGTADGKADTVAADVVTLTNRLAADERMLAELDRRETATEEHFQALAPVFYGEMRPNSVNFNRNGLARSYQMVLTSIDRVKLARAQQLTVAVLGSPVHAQLWALTANKAVDDLNAFLHVIRIEIDQTEATNIANNLSGLSNPDAIPVVVTWYSGQRVEDRTPENIVDDKVLWLVRR